jgi:hypothetical protein
MLVLVLMLMLMLDAGVDYDSKNFKSPFSQGSKFRQTDHEQEHDYEHEGKTRTPNIQT